MKTVKVLGLVLRTRKYGEADHLLSLLTPELGKISAIAKGARKVKGSMRGKTQPFVYGKFLLYRGKNLYTVTQVEIITSFNQLGEDVEKYGYASYVCELTEAVLINDHPQLDLFPLLLGVLHAINIEKQWLVPIWYQLQLLKSLGYEPQFNLCIVCGGEVKEGNAFFNREQGGIVCEECSYQPSNLSGGARAAVTYLLRVPLAKLNRVKLTKNILTEVEQRVGELIRQHLNKPLKSEEFLQCIKKD